MSVEPHPAPQSSPIPSHELAVKVMQQTSRAGIEVSKIEPNAATGAASVIVKPGTYNPEALMRLAADLSGATGWRVSMSTETQVVEVDGVIDVEFTEVQAPVAPNPGAEVPIVHALARRDSAPASFGLVPLSLAASTMQLVSSGNSLQLASHMLDDSSLISALAGVPPYRVRGAGAQEAVQADIVALQNVHPVVEAARAAGNLRWAVTELSRIQQHAISERTGMYIGSVASMLLTALGSVDSASDRAAFQKPYLELLQTINRPVAESVRKLLDPAAAGSREAFQSLFSSLLSLAAFAQQSAATVSGDAETAPQLSAECAQAFLVGSLILRQILHTFRDPARESLVPIITERFAGELQKILVAQDPRERGLLILMAGCRESTLEFFEAVLTRYIGEKEENRGRAVEERRFGKAPDSTMRADAVECLLGAACMISPGEDGFYGELDSRYQFAHPLMRGPLLQAMKFGIGDDQSRAESLVARALDLMSEQSPGLKQPLRAEAKDLLKHFPQHVVAAFSAEGCQRFRALSPEDRRFVMEDLLLPRVTAPSGTRLERQEILPLIEADLSLSGSKAFTRTVLKDFYSADFLETLAEPSRTLVRRALLRTQLEIEDSDLRDESRRILAYCGFPSISEAFAMSREKEATEPELARVLLLVSAELASRFHTEDPGAQRAIGEFTLKTVIPQFVGLASRKHEASIHMRQTAGQLESKREAFASVSAEVARMSPIVSIVRSHPGYQRATGEGLVEMVKGEPKARKGTLQEIDARIEAAEVRGDDEAKSVAQTEREQVLRLTFKRVPKCPNWPDKLNEVPLSQLIELIALHATKQAEADVLRGEIAALEGGQDTFVSDPHEDGKTRWSGTSGGKQGERSSAFQQQARDALVQGKILRLYLSSPALDSRTAQKAYDSISPHETAGALARFTLSLRHKIVDSSTLREAVEANEGDALRQVMREDLGVDIGANEEVRDLVKSAQAYDPEAAFAQHAAGLIGLAGFEDEVRSVVEAVRELAESGAYRPSGMGAPLLSMMVARLQRDEGTGFSGVAADSWSADANRDTVFTIVHALKNLDPATRVELDKLFRTVASTWLAHWEPPRDPSLLSAPTMLSAIESYLGEGSHDSKRRAALALHLGKKCLEHLERLPHSQRRAYLRTLEIAQACIPEEFREKTVTVDVRTTSGVEKYKVKPSELFATVVGKLHTAINPESYSGVSRTSTSGLRLPFGARPEGGMGLLPPPIDSTKMLGDGRGGAPAS